MSTAPQPDLTHAEALIAFRNLGLAIGPRAEIRPSLQVVNHGTAEAILTSVYPEGILGKGLFYVRAETYRDTLERVTAEWEERGSAYIAKTIREMALAIIGITADQGECTDAALRAQFDASDVTKFGERACEQATAMASNGPFSIVKLSGANDAEAA